MRASYIALAALIGVTAAIPCGPNGGGIVAENDLRIPVSHLRDEMNQEEFNRVLDHIENLYAPEVTQLGAKLVIERKWKDGKVNAYARQRNKTWIITMFGGLARHPSITSDGFATVACHELGHHLGGYPKKARWASSEGQSDYYASTKCFRRYVEDDDNVRLMAKVQVPQRVQIFCRLTHLRDEDVAICQRSAMAGLSLANLFAALSKTNNAPPQFQRPSHKRVSRHNHNHPAPQCRLDTYFQGALCPEGAWDEVALDDNDPSQGYCSRIVGRNNIGTRPRCWFAPTY